MSAERPGLGLLLALLAFFIFTAMDTTVKWLSGGYPLAQILVAMALGSFVPLSVVTARQGGIGALRTRRLGMHALRGLFALAAAFCAFTAYARMPIADAYTLLFTAPVIVTALSALVLKERVGPRRLAAVGLGFLGVLVALRPGQAGIDGPGALAAGFGACFYAVSMMLVRSMRLTETLPAQSFYSNATTLLVAGGMLPFVAVMPQGWDWLLLASLGLFSGTGQLLLISAYRTARSSVVAPAQYSQLLWGVAVGWFFWGTVPDMWMLAGAGIIAVAGLLLLERRAPAPAAA